MRADSTELKVDLGLARDQGPRPTCLSFSLSEIHQAAIALGELLSPESLHRRAAVRAKKAAGAGLAIREATDGLEIDGQTTEAEWPYNSEKQLNIGCVFHRTNAVTLPFDHKIIDNIIRVGQPISLIMDVDLEFFTCDGRTSLDLLAGSQIQGRHAVVICGFRTNYGGHEYLIKNSWGGGWGDKGYAWLTSRHVSARSPELVRI